MGHLSRTPPRVWVIVNPLGIYISESTLVLILFPGNGGWVEKYFIEMGICFENAILGNGYHLNNRRHTPISMQ